MSTFSRLDFSHMSRDELEKWAQKEFEKRLALEERVNFLADNPVIDPLTKLSNRAKLEEDYAKLSHRATNGVVGLLMIDIDHFKNINDTYGHDIGDHTLICFVPEMQTQLRAGDRAYRVGGEEFVCLVLPHGDDEHDPKLIIHDCATRIVDHISQVAWWKYGVPKVTVSVGYAQGYYDTPLSKLLREADRAMYRAKHRGRDQVAGGTGMYKKL